MEKVQAVGWFVLCIFAVWVQNSTYASKNTLFYSPNKFVSKGEKGYVKT